MRVAVWHNLPSGGGNRALHDHVRGLVDRGHTVEVWCPPTANRTFAPLGPMVREHVVPLDLPAPRRLTEKLQLTLQAARELAAMEAHCARCASEIDAAGFDILFANSCQFFRTSPIGRLARTPSVIYLQEPYRWLYEAMPRLIWAAQPSAGWSALRPNRLKGTFLDWRNIRNARLQARHEVDDAAAFRSILVNSHFSREYIVQVYGLDADVCYLGIDSAHFTDAGLPHGTDVVGLGAVTPEKDVASVVRALAALPEPRPRLVWIGNMALPDYQAEVTDLAIRLGVVLEFQIGIPSAKLLEILGTAMAMVYAPRLEPFGLAPLEANACGVPVVAVEEGGVRETIQDNVNGLHVQRTPASIAEALARIMRDPGLADRLRVEGRRLVEQQWSIAAATLRLEKALLGALASRSGQP